MTTMRVQQISAWRFDIKHSSDFHCVQESFSSFVWSYGCLRNRRTLQKVAWVITTKGKKNNENPTYNQSIIIKSVYWAAADVKTSAAQVKAGNGRWKRACTLSLPFINKLAPENLCGQFPVEKRLGNFSPARLMPSWLQSHRSKEPFPLLQLALLQKVNFPKALQFQLRSDPFTFPLWEMV